MKKLIFLAILALNFTSEAQIYHDRIGFDLESISDIDIGWMSIRKHNEPPKGKQLGERVYSAKQIGNCQLFVEWMQQSYLPKGCLGDATYYQNYIPKFNSTNSLLGNARNMHANALPLMYGAVTKIYMFLKKDAQGKFVPQNNLNDDWRIEVNQIQNISLPVSFISSTQDYYFILPDFKNNSKGYEDGDKGQADLAGFDTHKNLQPYRHFLIPQSEVRENAQFVVIMSKEKELPFEKLTIGQFFTEAEKQFPFWQKIDPVSAENYAKALKNLIRLKEKYKSKWNEIAELEISKIDISLIDFVNATTDYEDMFDNKNNTSFPIMKVKNSARELCKLDQPQWLVIRWAFGMVNQPYFMHFHESILNNFNFDYAYNYFFNSEKVKGQSYKPLRSPTFKQPVAVANASETANKATADKNVFFFEDFSTTAPGNKPAGWLSRLANAGTTALVKNPDGADGNWVELRGHYIGAVKLNKPLPENFTFSYDLAASQNFTWGSKGLTMQLSRETSPGKAESYLQLRLRPGFDGRNGEAMLETKFPFPPGYANESKWYAAPGFSNNKKFNRVTVTIKKAGEKLQVFIDKEKIAEYQKAIPAAHLFNALFFDCNGNSAENDKYYISNIRITRD